MLINKPTLEEAIIAAAAELGVSAAALEYTLIQRPRAGLWGTKFLAREAIIEIKKSPVSAGCAGAAVAGAGGGAGGAGGAQSAANSDNARPRKDVLTKKFSDKFERNDGGFERDFNAERGERGDGAAENHAGGAADNHAGCAEKSTGAELSGRPPKVGPSERSYRASDFAAEGFIDASFTADTTDTTATPAKSASTVVPRHLRTPHAATAPRLSSEQIDRAKAELAELLAAPVDAAQNDFGSLDVRIDLPAESALLGKDDAKFASLDLLVNHYTNIVYGVHSRVWVRGVLERAAAALDEQLGKIAAQIEQNGRASTPVFGPSLLNIAYERLCAAYPHKIINIKEAAAGRYICIWGRYDEHYRASGKRKH